MNDYLKHQIDRIEGIDDQFFLDKLSKLGIFWRDMGAVEKAIADIRTHGNRYLAMIELIKSFNVTPKNILEVGCNSGLMSMFIKDHHPDCNVVAIDKSERQVKAARLIGNLFPNIVHFLTMNGDAITDELDPRFDVVLLCEILEHLEEGSELQRKVLSESLYVTHENGFVIVSTPYEGKIPSPGHLTEFTSKSLRDLLESEADYVIELDRARRKFGLERHLIFIASNQPIEENIYQ